MLEYFDRFKSHYEKKKILWIDNETKKSPRGRALKQVIEALPAVPEDIEIIYATRYQIDNLVDMHNYSLVVIGEDVESLYCKRSYNENLQIKKILDKIDHLKVPTHTLAYEDLIADPKGEIDRLANFIGITTQRKRRRAYSLVGKNRALRRYYLHRLFVRAPRKLVRLIRGIG